jgi:hypothetical protein
MSVAIARKDNDSRSALAISICGSTRTSASATGVINAGVVGNTYFIPFSKVSGSLLVVPGKHVRLAQNGIELRRKGTIITGE